MCGHLVGRPSRHWPRIEELNVADYHYAPPVNVTPDLERTTPSMDERVQLHCFRSAAVGPTELIYLLNRLNICLVTG